VLSELSELGPTIIVNVGSVLTLFSVFVILLVCKCYTDDFPNVGMDSSVLVRPTIVVIPCLGLSLCLYYDYWGPSSWFGCLTEKVEFILGVNYLVKLAVLDIVRIVGLSEVRSDDFRNVVLDSRNRIARM
jgi:hypothetical protein